MLFIVDKEDWKWRAGLVKLEALRYHMYRDTTGSPNIRVLIETPDARSSGRYFAVFISRGVKDDDPPIRSSILLVKERLFPLRVLTM